MTTSSTRRTTQLSSTRAGVITYWTTTVILATECLVGGVMGGLRLPPFIGIATDLGYPAYFMTILGIWYISAGLVLLAPGLPRPKEWAYAGLIFNYTGAAASHIWVGDGFDELAGPLFFLALTAASWALRPRARRDFTPTPLMPRSRGIVYWCATVLVAAELAVGGVWDLLQTDQVRDVVEHLGYPTYLLTIMGVWKVPGAVVLLIPGFPRLKEWVYAGAVITYVCAVASHLTVGDGIGAVAAPVALLALTAISWALRPPRSRGMQFGQGDADSDLDLADRHQRWSG
jgi:uncharacterized membrane protein YphA (DoxX/SURF4 family)